MATTKHRKIHLARLALGVIAVVWLNLVFQPCAMALGGEMDHDCPHCPPSHEQQSRDHGMAANELPCATGSADCSMLNDINYEGRQSTLTLKDTPNDLPLAIVSSAEFQPNIQHTRVTNMHSPRSPPPGSRTPLNVLYCVYLN